MRHLDWSRVRTVAKHDLKQLLRSKDFLIPMAILGGLFFVVLPAMLLASIEAIGPLRDKRSLPFAPQRDKRQRPRARLRPALHLCQRLVEQCRLQSQR